jgi:anti-sigma regulatory factor (Ser/Thr protein kinase)
MDPVMGDRVSDKFTLPAALERIDDARRWSTSCAREAAVDEDTIQDLELAMTEALSNTIRHGYQQDASQNIELSLDIDRQRISLSIVDRGDPYDPSMRRPIDFEGGQEGGYGLYLLEQLTDELLRTPREDGGTLVTLVKYRKEQ